MKLNQAKCAFIIPPEKLLDFIVRKRGIGLHPRKIKTIQDLPPPNTKKEVMSFLEKINSISQFIDQSTMICEPIFKLLRNDAPIKWTKQCQKAFDTIKSYLENVPVLVPPRSRCPYFNCIYMCVTTHSGVCWDNMMRVEERRELYTI